MPTTLHLPPRCPQPSVAVAGPGGRLRLGSGVQKLPLVDVPGGRVEYDDVPGDPAHAPLLFLHEGLGSVGLWRGFHRRIAAATGRRAGAYSRLGHGFSDLPRAKRTPR